MVYQNGLSSYLQIRRMSLDDDWQMKSIWITSSLVWLTGAGLFLGFWRQVSACGDSSMTPYSDVRILQQNGKEFKGKGLILSCLVALVFATGASGFGSVATS